jgi:hypothetical protein
MLNAEVPDGLAGAGPLGGSPARGDAAAWHRHHGISAPSSTGSRDVHLGLGHNSPTGESTSGAGATPEAISDTERESNPDEDRATGES